MNSTFKLSQTDGRPMYLQIMEQIKQRVAVGEWPTGMELPSIRKLALDLKISVITVNRAYAELEREGVIITQQGKGSRVSSNKKLAGKLKTRQLEAQLEKTVELGLAMNVELRDLLKAMEKHYNKRMSKSTTA